MEHIVFRSALLPDVPAIVALLADDELGSQREITGTPLDQRYVDALKAIEADANQRLVVVVDGNEVSARCRFHSSLALPAWVHGEGKSKRFE